MATSEYGGDQLHLTEGLRHRGEYECNNPTSQTHGTFYDISCKGAPSLALTEKSGVSLRI